MENVNDGVNRRQAIKLLGAATLAGVALLRPAASREAARAARREHGGELGDFAQALRQAHLDQAEDTVMIRQRRAQRHKMMNSGGHGAGSSHGHGH